jgi:hypothetical protein
MAIYFGNDKIKEIYVGSDKIKEVYYGSEKVWGEVEPIQEGYWVHKDTGVKTYFDLDADFITDGIMNYPSWAYDCSEVNIPESVTSLKRYCFAGSNALTSITLPKSITSLGAYCFNGCTSLNLATVLPAIPPSLGGQAFNNVHPSFNIKVRSPYVNDYKTATNWTAYASIISAI